MARMSGGARLRIGDIARGAMIRPEVGAILGFLLLWTIFAILGAGNGFFSVAAIAGILEVSAQIGIVGTSVSLLMISGQFDLSVGSTVGATGMLLALGLAVMRLPVWAAVALALPLFVLSLMTMYSQAFNPFLYFQF